MADDTQIARARARVALAKISGKMDLSERTLRLAAQNYVPSPSALQTVDSVLGESENSLHGYLADALTALAEELAEARRSQTRIMELVSDADNWDNPTDTLEHIGDVLNSEQYPVWERYEG